jgi:TIR domain
MKVLEDDCYDVHLVFDPSERALAEAIEHRLVEADLTCTLHPAEVAAGEDFSRTVHEMNDSSRSVVFLMSRASSTSQVVAALAGAAWAGERPILVLRNQVRPSDYSPFFKRFPNFVLWTGFARFVKAVSQVPERATV